MRSHAGLGAFKEGQEIRYSNGKSFADAKQPLFPPQDELAGGVMTANSSSEQSPQKLATQPDSRQPPSKPTNTVVQNAHTEASRSTLAWQECAVVDGQGWARVRRHPSHKYRATPDYIIPTRDAKGLTAAQRPFPLANQAPATPPPQLPTPPPEWLKQEVKSNLRGWEDCVEEEARQGLQHAVNLALRDEVVLSGGASAAHRQRARCGDHRAEVRIGPDKLHPTVNKVLQLGLSLRLEPNSRPTISELHPLKPADWGINAAALIEDAQKIRWADEELIFFLKYGFMDYSGASPPICSFSPHQQKALLDLPTFHRQVREEIAKGWIGPAQAHPPTIPFHVNPGSIEPKPGGSSRLVWNASWPAPGSDKSACRIANEWMPIAPNSSTMLPARLEFEWTAIETNNEIIDILADGALASGAPLLGRTFDFTKWFRQLGMANLDLWKCIVHVDGGFRQDNRMQMGRRSSAHSGQRTTFLLATLLQRAACQENWGLRDISGDSPGVDQTEQRALAQWLRRRHQVTQATSIEQHSNDPQLQSCLVHFSSFQDDLTAIALGRQAAKDATEGVIRLLQDKYGIPLSTKQEATKDFSHRFTSIGATYDLSNPANIDCRPKSEKIEKYRNLISAIKQASQLIPLLDMQRFAGVHTFMARFLEAGEFYCNSAYCCLRAIPNTSAHLRPVSRDLLRDAERVLHLLENGELAPLTNDPIFAHPGHQGFSADASGATEPGAEGWGIHFQGVISSGKWPRGIKSALANMTLSISPLELLAVAIALAIATKHKNRLPRTRQLIIRSDSESTCAVINSMRADSAPMLEALRVFKEVQEASGLRIRMQYIPTKENSIADKLSRGAEAQARRELEESGVVIRARHPNHLTQWCSRVLQAALQATRHSKDTTGKSAAH